jgi:hypothetical protein
MALQRKKPAAIGVNAPYPGFVEPDPAETTGTVPYLASARLIRLAGDRDQRQNDNHGLFCPPFSIGRALLSSSG